MTAPRVVVIEHDEWILRLLQDGLRDGGFVVATAPSVEDGLARIRDLAPDCVICEVSLPDGGGYALARAIRADAPPISLTPIALLAAEEDVDARTAAFEAGADSLLTRPFKLDEIIAQLSALVQLARRMRERRTSLIDSLRAGPESSPEGASFRGDLQHMPVASLLMLLELERKTGRVSVKCGGRTATLDLADGAVVATTLDGDALEPVATLRDALGWSEGRITFRAKPRAVRPPSARSIRLLLAEARHPGSPTSARLPGADAANPGGNPAIPPPARRPVASPVIKRREALNQQPTVPVDVPQHTRPNRPKESDLIPPPPTKRSK